MISIGGFVALVFALGPPWDDWILDRDGVTAQGTVYRLEFSGGEDLRSILYPPGSPGRSVPY